MISTRLAFELDAAGLSWTPVSGDRFVLRQPGLDGDVFVVSDMTIEVHSLPTGRVVGFNGTTEWALDSVDQGETVWLPSEEQLRGLLEERFRSLERTSTGHRVLLTTHESQHTFEAAEPADAYALALLHLLQHRHLLASG